MLARALSLIASAHGRFVHSPETRGTRGSARAVNRAGARSPGRDAHRVDARGRRRAPPSRSEQHYPGHGGVTGSRVATNRNGSGKIHSDRSEKAEYQSTDDVSGDASRAVENLTL